MASEGPTPEGSSGVGWADVCWHPAVEQCSSRAGTIAGQGALAFVTAATHGLEEEVARLEEALQPELAGELKAGLEGDAQLLLPPMPILREDNWPLLTVSKGFFESLAAGGVKPWLSSCPSSACCPPLAIRILRVVQKPSVCVQTCSCWGVSCWATGVTCW